MTYQHILYDVKDRIATVTLNRPERLNALSDDMVQEVWAALFAASDDPEVRVIVLTGTGRAFCAGADVGNFASNDANYLIAKLKRPFDMNRRADYQTRHSLFPAIPKPVIGMLNGSAAGLGLLYALFCDLRFAAEDAVFTTAFARIGLSAEYGAAWILRETVGHSNALDLLISGRK
jgi:enoyl-CoA hydratase/carnithine racemase